MSENPMYVVETHNLTKIYGSKYIALNGAHLAVPRGSVFGLVGPNGAGKTTTIRLLLGLHNPTAGRVDVFGEPMTPNATHLRRRIGYLPTNPHFPADMTPIAYLDFIGKISGLPPEVRKPRLAALLRAVGLLSAASQKVKGFSTGMTTRLGIAASLINDPELLIWDEPTSGLDPEGRKYTIDLIQELGQTKTIIVSSHNLADVKKVCTHIGVISEGMLIFNGPVQQMRRFTGAGAVELELDGDVGAVERTLAALPDAPAWALDGARLRVTFPPGAALAAGLSRILTAVADSGAVLTRVDSVHDDMVDAFIHLLEEERSHGFSRILRLESQGDSTAVGGVLGAAGIRPEDDGALLGGAHLVGTDDGAGADYDSDGVD